jgi:ATP-dependent helicase/DNAse subunit B
MALTLITGPANAGKAQRVLDAVRARAAHDPVLVVPTFRDVQAYRRELSGSGAVFGPQVLRFDWLAREIATRVGVAARPVSRAQRERLVAAAVDRAELRALAASGRAAGFAAAAGELIAELQRSLVTPQRFAAALASWAQERAGAADEAREIAAIYSH